MKKSLRMIHVMSSLVLLLTACGPVTPAPTPTPLSTATPAPSPISLSDPQRYLSDALDIIQKNALNRNKVDWVKIRAVALSLEKDAKTPADTYDTIISVLQLLRDHHSFFMTPEKAKQMNDSTAEDYPAPQGKLLENRIGYVAVFGFLAQKPDEMNKYANKIQNIIIELDKKSVCGWIVDLQEDTGGNMYPMIAGLGALIGEGELGSFKDTQDQTYDWYYRDGYSGAGNTPVAKVSKPEFLLNPDETPVAVLIGRRTASSGEITAISFQGRTNTRFFGRPSAGLTTSNRLFTLNDGAIILLTTAVDLDRTGRKYGGSITPDVETPQPESDAAAWLLAQPACKK